jgi:hypothetical protein
VKIIKVKNVKCENGQKRIAITNLNLHERKLEKKEVAEEITKKTLNGSRGS